MPDFCEMVSGILVQELQQCLQDSYNGTHEYPDPLDLEQLRQSSLLAADTCQRLTPSVLKKVIESTDLRPKY